MPWPEEALGELTERVAKCDPAKSGAHKFTYIDLGSVDREYKAITGDVTMSVAEAPSRARQVVAGGDVLVSTVRPNLNAVAQVPPRLDGATASTGFAVLRPRPDRLDSRYLFHWVRHPSFVAKMVRLATGASYPAVSDRIVRASLITVPPMEEQRRIAHILDCVDELRAKRQAALTTLESLTKAVFLAIFGDLQPFGQRRSCRLGDHLLFVTSGGRGWAKYYSDRGARFIRSLDVRMNHIGSREPAFVVPPDDAEARRTKVYAGDVLLTITGSRIGRVAVVPPDLAGSYVSQHVAILRIDTSVWAPEYLSFFLSLDRGGQRQIARAQYGQTKPGLNFEQIRAFQIPTPARAAQEEFVERAAAISTMAASHQAFATKMDDLCRALQYRAFRGEL